MINWKFWQKPEPFSDKQILSMAGIYMKRIWKDDWRSDDQGVIDFAKAVKQLGDKYVF